MRQSDVLKLAAADVRRMVALCIAVLLLGCTVAAAAIDGLIGLCDEANEPYSREFLLSDGADIAAAQGIEGVKAVTRRYPLSLQLSCEGNGLSADVLGVDADYIAGMELIAGSRFDEAGNMPYIVINTAALDAFEGEQPLDREKALALVGEEMLLTGEREYIGILYGVTEDGGDAPCAYMSEEIAKRLFAAKEDGALVRMDGLWRAKSAEEELAKVGFAPKAKDEHYTQWNAQIVSTALTAAVGLLIIACALLYDALRHKRTQEEARALRALGVNGRALRATEALRYAGLTIILTAAALLLISVLKRLMPA